MDASQYFGNDLILASDGDLAKADGATLTQQRILRRLLTAIKGYLWHPNYGAGLPQYIGQNLSEGLQGEIIGNIKNQMFLEDTVAQQPEPQISLTTSNDNVLCSIRYQEQPSGKVFTLSFSVSIYGTTT